MKETRALSVPLAFIVDEEVVAHILLRHDQENYNVPEKVMALLNAGKFEDAAKDTNSELDDVLYFEKDDAADVMDAAYVDYNSAANFEGHVDYLASDLTTSKQRVFYNDGYILYLRAYNNPKPLKSAYPDIDAVAKEFQGRLGKLMPDENNFDWTSKLVRIEGTYEEEN